MALSLPDLEKHLKLLQKKLVDLVTQKNAVDKEIESTRYLISQEKAREHEKKIKRPYVDFSIEAAIRDVFMSGKYDAKLTAQQITSILLVNGIQGQEDSIRSNVGITLKRLYEVDQFLNREDVTKGKQPLYVYWLRERKSKVGSMVRKLGSVMGDEKE